MLSLSSSARYFLYRHPVDMRCGIYSLAGLVQNDLGMDPLSGDVFIFIGKRGNQLRLLQWDTDGYALYSKRLESGTFERPTDGKLLITSRELSLVLQGVKLASVQLRRRYERSVQA
ncbi:IS66 family insertion sequence element accessory protein TnpB [Lunatimonas salinarum]|uniref:IS66 family insertion sequence element accessory protein TnpB n=1 Tax=Lunatimonas salinarum TaxID=1774590 RepID=UPI001AE0C853|nr:IS66 family insertion sequence element accessory protein TnpB [Lunatimonas salinarum]